MPVTAAWIRFSEMRVSTDFLALGKSNSSKEFSSGNKRTLLNTNYIISSTRKLKQNRKTPTCDAPFGFAIRSHQHQRCVDVYRIVNRSTKLIIQVGACILQHEHEPTPTGTHQPFRRMGRKFAVAGVAEQNVKRDTAPIDKVLSIIAIGRLI